MLKEESWYPNNAPPPARILRKLPPQRSGNVRSRTCPSLCAPRSAKKALKPPSANAHSNSAVSRAGCGFFYAPNNSPCRGAFPGRFAVIEHRPPVKRRGNRVFVCHRFREIRCGLKILFHSAHKTFQPFESFNLLAVSQPRAVQSPAQNRNRLVIGLERHRKRMAIFSASENENRAGS